MKVLKICKAQPTIYAVTQLTIEFMEEIPYFKILHNQDLFMGKQARDLEKALYNVLPGGTYDRLLGEMLKRKSTHFRVAHEEKAEGVN